QHHITSHIVYPPAHPSPTRRSSDLTATRVSERSTLEARNNGVVKFVDLKHVEGRGGTLIAMNRAGLIAIVDEKGREKERYHVVRSEEHTSELQSQSKLVCRLLLEKK